MDQPQPPQTLNPRSRTVNLDITSILANINRLGIDWRAVPNVPIWESAFGNGPLNRVRLSAAMNIVGLSQALGRPLTSTETNALAYHNVKREVIPMYGFPVTFITTLVLERRGQARYKFPFWTPKSTFNPNKLLFLRGHWARFAIHTGRWIAYYTLIDLLVSGFLKSFAGNLYRAKTMTDNRLEHIYSELKAKDINNLVINLVSQTGTTPREQFKEMSRSGSIGAASGESTMSSPDGFEGASPSDWGETSDAEARMAPAQMRPTPRQMPAAQQASYSDEQSPFDGSQGGGVFDDASPVAGSHQAQSQSQHGQGQSVWDRIRSGARSGNARGQTQSSQQQPQGSNGMVNSWAGRRQDAQMSQGARDGTSYNFSRDDEEKSYAKEQAQRDFDEMLERERQGTSRNDK